MINLKISVIIPIYNVETYLRRCLDSVINQTYENLEIILVDDGSTDNSFLIAQQYCDKDPRCIFLHQSNSGLSSARNLGLKHATGNLISFIDSDDWISLDMFSTLMKCYEDTGADIVSGKYILTETAETNVDNDTLKYQCITENKLRYYLENSFDAKCLEIPVWNKLYSRYLFESITFPEGELYEDMFTSYKLIKNAKMWCVCNQIVYFYFQGGKSITRNKFSEKNLQILRPCNQILDDIQKDHTLAELYPLAIMFKCKNYLSILIRIVQTDDNSTHPIILEAQNFFKKNRNIIKKSNLDIKKKIMIRVSKNICLFKIIVNIFYKHYLNSKLGG